ncbi:hypothetical protein L596_016561 [Steinernema carpocapsae]|uniref:Uncharacterized protein n=1 Tax=Steinernema carpocapsae TaxID=34508 RepID=A0A4U5NIC1_STECR|nr:hypothetical protein L596_016561 [Steinernema carpocapsae]
MNLQRPRSRISIDRYRSQADIYSAGIPIIDRMAAPTAEYVAPPRNRYWRMSSRAPPKTREKAPKAAAKPPEKSRIPSPETFYRNYKPLGIMSDRPYIPETPEEEAKRLAQEKKALAKNASSVAPGPSKKPRSRPPLRIPQLRNYSPAPTRSGRDALKKPRSPAFKTPPKARSAAPGPRKAPKSPATKKPATQEKTTPVKKTRSPAPGSLKATEKKKPIKRARNAVPGPAKKPATQEKKTTTKRTQSPAPGPSKAPKSPKKTSLAQSPPQHRYNLRSGGPVA